MKNIDHIWRMPNENRYQEKAFVKHSQTINLTMSYFSGVVFLLIQISSLFGIFGMEPSLKATVTLIIVGFTCYKLRLVEKGCERFGLVSLHFMIVFSIITTKNSIILIICELLPFFGDNMTSNTKLKLLNFGLGFFYVFFFPMILQIHPYPGSQYQGIINYLMLITLYLASCWISFNYSKEIMLSIVGSQNPILIPDSDTSSEASKKDEAHGQVESNDFVEEHDKNLFYSNFSHEIRNSLNAIGISLDYLQRVITDKSQLAVLNNTRIAGKLLINYVNNILDASKVKSDNIELHYLQAKPSELLRQVLAITQDNIFKKGVALRAFIDKSMPIKFNMDSSRVLQILINLITNSMKFTEKGGLITIYNGYSDNEVDLLKPFDNQDSQENVNESPSKDYFKGSPRTPIQALKKRISSNDDSVATEIATPHIKKIGIVKMKTMHELSEMHEKLTKKFKPVDLTRLNTSNSTLQRPQSFLSSKGYLKYQVTDSGCGMNKLMIKTILSDEKRSIIDDKEEKIHGISLWVCQMLIKKMGGKLDIISREKKGTTVIFYIPVEIADTPRVEINSATQKESLRALIVDDLAYNRDIHKLILNKEKVLVDLACNGKECCDILFSKPGDYYDFIISDIDMPEMDGLAAAKEIRKHELQTGKKAIDIYFVSGNQEENTFKTISSIYSNQAVTKFIAKPMEISTVKQIIANYSRILRKPVRISSRHIVQEIEEVSSPHKLKLSKDKSDKVMRTLSHMIS